MERLALKKEFFTDISKRAKDNFDGNDEEGNNDDSTDDDED